jgi:REP element-mobilizing transposase RayT
VIPGAWHHATQCGNARQEVFFNHEDRALYLALLQRYAARYAVRITGYCLMSNHVHIVAAPADSGRSGRWICACFGQQGRILDRTGKLKMEISE